MSERVARQVAGLAEPLAAQQARERLLLGMNARVARQIGEALVALHTRVQIYACMSILVISNGMEFHRKENAKYQTARSVDQKNTRPKRT